MADPGRDMIIVTVAENDIGLSDLECPACNVAFLGGMEVFLSRDEGIAIHTSCVVALALVASLRSQSEIDVDAEAERKAEGLLRGLEA